MHSQAGGPAQQLPLGTDDMAPEHFGKLQLIVEHVFGLSRSLSWRKKLTLNFKIRGRYFQCVVIYPWETGETQGKHILKENPLDMMYEKCPVYRSSRDTHFNLATFL